MTKEDAIKEVNKAFEPAFANYIITALTKGATVSDRCEDAVSREQALLALTGKNLSAKSAEELIRLFNKRIKALPPVEPTREKGKWIIDDKEYGRIWKCHCSKCGKDPQIYVGGSENWWLVRLPNYCPKCGIEMESDKK